MFFYQLVSKSTIGSKKWKKLSDEERENFLVALKNYLSKRVSVYVTNYVATDINFKIIKNEFVGKNDKYIKVYSTVSGSGTDMLAGSGTDMHAGTGTPMLTGKRTENHKR